MVFLFVGPPASGKSTQAKRLHQKLTYDYVSVSSLLREEAKHDSHIAKIMDTGSLVSVSLVTKLLHKAHAKYPDNLVIDGALRRPKQVDSVVTIWKDARIVVIQIVTSLESIRHRAEAREEGRHDDDPQVVEHRIREYQSTLSGIRDRIKHYHLTHITINGNQPIEAIHDDIMNEVKKVTA